MGESNEVYNLGDGKVRAESRVVLVGEKKKRVVLVVAETSSLSPGEGII